MGKLIQETFPSKLKNFINDYKDIKIKYEEKYKESLNHEPYDSINNYELKECKYKISLVISSWNSGHTLMHTLKSIEHTYICRNFNDKFEVVIVDDGSNDNTEEVVTNENYCYKIKYIKQIHLGRAQGINMACKHAEGDMIIFCDADVILFPFTIDEIIKRQQENLDDTICFGFREDIEDVCDIKDLEKFIYSKQPEFWLDNRFCTDFRGSWSYNMLNHSNMLQSQSCMKNFWVSDSKVSMYDCWQLYRMVYGFLFAVSKKNFDKIGGFAEFLVGWGSDDTCFVALAIEQGIKIIPVPSATCCHIKHPIRMKTQWEDGRKNEERMNKYLAGNIRTDFLNKNFDERIIKKVTINPKTKPIKNLIKYKAVFENIISEGRYYYYLGNYQKSLDIYLKEEKNLSLDDLEKMFECIIKTNKKDAFNLITNNSKYGCYFYQLANYCFYTTYDKNTTQERSYHMDYLKLISKEEHLKRAQEYYEEKQWYLALLDYFGLVLLGEEQYLEKCDECIKKEK